MPREVTPVTGCVLLAGGLRASPLNVATECSVLDLWLGPGQTLLDRWLHAAQTLSHARASPAFVRVVHNQYLPSPQPRPDLTRRAVFLHDPRPYRGPAGVLRDVVDPEENGTLLVAEAARVPPPDLRELARTHARSGADVTVIANPDATPAGLYFATVASLEAIASRGYVDIKEQWLPTAVADGFDVRVITTRSPVLPLSTPRDLIRAAQQGRRTGDAACAVVRRDQRHEASVICPGSIIGRDAVVAHSLIMPGAKVGVAAIVVRSVLLPHARVADGAVVVDELVRGVHETAWEQHRAA